MRVHLLLFVPVVAVVNALVVVVVVVVVYTIKRSTIISVSRGKEQHAYKMRPASPSKNP